MSDLDMHTLAQGKTEIKGKAEMPADFNWQDGGDRHYDNELNDDLANILAGHEPHTKV